MFALHTTPCVDNIYKERNRLKQEKIDSISNIISNLSFYENIVYKNSSHLHLMMLFLKVILWNISLKQKTKNSLL